MLNFKKTAFCVVATYYVHLNYYHVTIIGIPIIGGSHGSWAWDIIEFYLHWQKCVWYVCLSVIPSNVNISPFIPAVLCSVYQVNYRYLALVVGVYYVHT